ncbi:MAG: S41 family peptidase [Treponema sp.]|nr:S41 family peptidase [Treponema sp.]
MKRTINNIKKVTLSFLILTFASQCFAQSSIDSDSKISSFQYMKKLNSVFDFVQMNYVDDLDPKLLYEGALKGMLEAIGDPYTLYLDSDYMRDLGDTTNGSFGGVGLTISKPTENKPDKPAYVEVSSPIEDSPGAKAGIQSGDYIVAIEGKPTPEMSMNEVLANLRGEVGTPVNITILRGANMKFDIKLVRALIEVPTVKDGMIEGTKIGYMRLIQFTPETPKRVQEAIDGFKAAGYTSLIIDLRDNPGGLITSAVEVGDKFISEGPIVSTKSRLILENHQFTANKDKTIVSGIPIVVLINHGSASASEILSGALKDNHLAYLVGERTYGKGSVQQVVPLREDNGIKLTIARYYTPSDTNIDKIGIPPDLEIHNVEKFSKEQEELYVKMFENQAVQKIADENPNMKESEIAAAAEKLAKEYPFDLRLLRRLIRVQLMRHQPTPLFDMDYDVQLKEAIRILKEEKFSELVKQTKTLKQLQDEAAEKDSKETVAIK